jgi:tellurite resistance protein TerA
MALVPGANAPVTTLSATVVVDYTPVAGAELDVSAFLLSASGRVRSDDDMCFYGQPVVEAGAIRLLSGTDGQTRFQLDLSRVPASVEKIALTATLHENRATFAAVSRLNVTVSGGIESAIPTQGMQETALILGEFYRRQGAWKYRCLGQGFRGGLKPLAEHFGIVVSDQPRPAVPAPAAPPVTHAPPPTSRARVSLNKISLDKHQPSISLDKGTAGFGEIKINLNWHRPAPSRGLLKSLLSHNKEVDLDIGCLYELQDGSIGVVQALGNAFGSFQYPPFIELMGDDRTGASQDGEWLRINGHQWSQIRRVLVFALIYEGAPNWQATDGVVTLHVPGQPPIEVRVSEEGGKLPACAIALLENDQGRARVSRQVRFFSSQKPMDEAYRWGLRWTAGRK